MAARRVDEFSRQFEVDVTWWPFELHPETPKEGRSLEAVIARRGPAYGEHLKSYAAEAGITLGSVRWLSNSHRALELTEFARDRGAFQAVHAALFEAYFSGGRDIGDLAVLDGIAAGAGLDPEEFRFEALVGRYAGLVDRCTEIARAKGVASTPAMIFDDRFLLTGAQDLQVYQDVLRRMGAEPRHPGIV
ncbi:MAG: DsbA family protein [Dehalococcoidia bacterium]